MAKITLDLNRFKASGIYTIEFDASERVVVSTQTVRLVVGFSRIGPFNAPVFLRDIRTARRIFGTIDSKLEARGSFFHRALETCLSVAPVFALNLLPLNNAPITEGGDAVTYRSFALAADEENGNITSALYASFYNKERFWFPDTEYLQATVDIKAANRGRLFNVVNLGQQAVSIIIKKSVNATQYNLPADEYYDADEIPPYVYAKDYMSDYFVDLYVVKGDWTNHSLLAKDPLYSKYFDLRGLIADKMDLFLSLDGITVLGSFTGCIIPNFLDNNGSNQSIDVIVNANYATTGIFLNINENELSDYENSTYKVDMIGNTLIDTTDDTIDFLSYNTPIKNILKYTSNNSLADNLATQLTSTASSSVLPYVKSYPYGGVNGKFGNVFAIPKPAPGNTDFTVAQWEALADNLNVNSLIRTNGTDTITDNTFANDYVKVDNIINTGSELLLKLSTPLHTDVNFESSNGVAEDTYIIQTVAATVPSTANTIVVENFSQGDAIATIGSTTQTTAKGQPLATVTAWTGGTGAIAAVATYTGKAVVGGGSGAIVSITTDVTGAITAIAVTTAGTGYKPGDTLTVAANWDGATATAITFTTFTFTPVVYTAVSSTTTGSGSGATFTVTYNAAGLRSVAVVSGGSNYAASDAITIPLANVGGAPATNITFTVATVTAGPSVDAGDIILIEAPGYAKYFEVASIPTVGATTSITVKSTSLTAGAPFYQSQTCTAGFAADEFAAYLQPSAIKVTIFDVDEAAASNLWPDTSVGGVANTFGYILNPDLAFASIDGIGQLVEPGADNLVTLYNVTTTTAIAGTWYILTSTAAGISLATGDVRVVGADGVSNPLTTQALNDIIRVTLPSGQTFTGAVNDVNASLGVSAYNLDGTDIKKYAQWEVYPGSKMAKDVKGSLMVDGDRVKFASTSSAYNYLNVDNNWGEFISPYSLVQYGLNGVRVRQYKDVTLLTPANADFANFDATYIDSTLYASGTENDAAIYSSLAKNIQENVAIEGTLFGAGKKFKLTAANASKIEVGDFVVNNDLNSPKLIRIITKVKKLDPSTGVAYYEYTTLDTIGVTVSSGVTYVSRFAPIQKFVDRYQFTVLSGFKMTDYHLPGTPAQLEKILGVLENTNVGETLKSRDVIQYRYIVDTFNGGLEPHMGPKQYLSRLAKGRQQCMALLNSPSMAEFQASTDPRFTELPDPAAGNPKPVLNTDYIATGGNLSLGPSYTWSLPDEENGAKFIGVFTPNIIIRESGKNKSVPPAADVSNNFVRKFINGEPYGIVAGPRRGVISNPKFVGMEYDFLLKDRENLEPIGLNPIVVVRNVGPMIFANQTAYQRTLSAFNNLHVRDLLITIEEAVIEILQNYLFEFNDAATRLEIKTLVETFLDVVRTGGGIYAYSVIMDDSNNTPEIIDQNFGILDIGVEPARGLQKFVNRITVLKTGAIASGGFAAV